MANIAVRDPFQDIRSLMQRTFNEPFFSGFPADWPARYGRVDSGLLDVDVFEKDGVLHVEAPLPGFDKDEVEVTLERGKLTIEASHEESSEEETERDGRRYFIRERKHGAVSRTLDISESWDADSVGGGLKNGVLTLTVKRSPAEQPRKIELN